VQQGVVHDPTARFMGGVAGSAGVFTTAGDLARYARMLLNGGELDGVRILSPESVRLLTTTQSPPGLAKRAMGMDIDSPYARPRGTIFPVGSFGHTGFTGCILWVDPDSKTFYVFLSNRVYPDDKSNIVPLYGVLGTLTAQAAGLSAPRSGE
jgi:CubicO group peptidase (beta-lactamase class C family)